MIVRRRMLKRDTQGRGDLMRKVAALHAELGMKERDGHVSIAERQAILQQIAALYKQVMES
jgi:hypothetical protein